MYSANAFSTVITRSVVRTLLQLTEQPRNLRAIGVVLAAESRDALAHHLQLIRWHTGRHLRHQLFELRLVLPEYYPPLHDHRRRFAEQQLQLIVDMTRAIVHNERGDVHVLDSGGLLVVEHEQE